MYANEKTVAKVFKRRIKKMITSNPVLRKLWSGKEDDLTIKEIELASCAWGVASAQNKDDIASFPAPFGYASECAKYKAKEFDPIAMLRGRQQAALQYGMYKMLLESSPWEVGDPMYKEIFQAGTIVLRPHVQCIHCKKWFVFIDSQIKELPPGDHNPARIRSLGAAAVQYECIYCGGVISEMQRIIMLQKVVWAAPAVQEEFKKAEENGELHITFRQDAEIITEDGEVVGDRSKFTRVCYNWNRLVDPGFTFFECLARFFEARHIPEKFRVYENEDMARFWRTNKRRLEESDLDNHIGGYFQYGENAIVPDGVIIATVGIDVQDNGFFYIIRGWGAHMESWLVRHEFIDCSIEYVQQAGHEAMLKIFRDKLQLGIEQQPLRTSDGKIVTPYLGMIDRGGHRPDDVDYICDKMKWIRAYIGRTQIDAKRPLIERAENEHWFLGQTKLISARVGHMLELPTWHLPVDVGSVYKRQVLRQYVKSELDKHEQPKTIYVSERDDHYRDCENLALAAALRLKLDKYLETAEGIQRIRMIMKTHGEIKTDEKKEHEAKGATVEPSPRIRPGERVPAKLPARTPSRNNFNDRNRRRWSR